MAFLWKHPECKFWYAGFIDRNGKRHNRSTREKNRKKAQSIADFIVTPGHRPRETPHNMLTKDVADRTTNGAGCWFGNQL